MRKKHNFILFLLLSGAIAISANAAVIDWQKTIGGHSEDKLTSICRTSDNGYILAGQSKSGISGDKTEDRVNPENHVFSDYWIIKVDESGNIVWQNTIGGPRFDSDITSIEETADGGYILAGGSSSISGGDRTENYYGGNDIWVIKLNAAGVIDWENVISGFGTGNGLGVDTPGAIHQTSDGGYILGASSSSSTGIDKTTDSFGGSDYWILKLDENGDIVWQKTYGGDSWDNLHSIFQTADNGYIVGGTSGSSNSGSKTEVSRGGNDYWVIKLDEDGDITWQKTIGGDQNDSLSTVIPTNGGYMVAGYSYSEISGDKTEENFGQGRPWFVKLNSSGSITGQHTLAQTWLHQDIVVKAASDGGFMVGGSWLNLDGQTSYEYWVAKTDSTGTIEWHQVVIGDSSDYLMDILLTADGGIALAGYSNSTLSGDKTESSFQVADDPFSSNDYWLVKLANSAPVVSNGQPTDILPGGTTSTVMSVETNENATCAWSETAGVDFSAMQQFTTTGALSHFTTRTGLTGGSMASCYVRCRNEAGYATLEDYEIRISVNRAGFNTLCEDEALTGVPQGECEILLSLYNSTNPAFWVNTTHWNTLNPVSSWYGITVRDSHVSEIRMDENNLDGPLPVNLANLPELLILTLSDNKLTGSVPAEYGSISGLQALYIASNYLTGTIPEELGNLTALRYFSLHDNQLSGSLPASLGNLTNMEFMYLYHNDLDGPLLPAFGDFSNLEVFAASGNSVPRGCTEDEGRSLGVGLQEQASNHLELLR